MPENELMVWTAGVTEWINYFENVAQRCAEVDAICPEHIKDEPKFFYSWLKAQHEKERSKISKGYR